MANEEGSCSNKTVSPECKMCKDISYLYLKQKFTDVCFLINDDKFYAHKIILAARSEYFETLLYGGLEESKQIVITVEDVPLEVFKMLLMYIYTDSVNISSGLMVSLEHGTEVLALRKEEAKATKKQYLYHKIKTGDNITVKLKTPVVVNHIHMTLHTPNIDEHYNYYVEVSLDEISWQKIVDHAHYPCRSVQTLFFQDISARYIRIVGTYGRQCNDFRVLCVEAYYKTNIPPMVNNFVRPLSNIATPQNGAVVIRGYNPCNLLNGDTKNYGSYSGYTYHGIEDSDPIVIQLAQPFVVSSMKLLLWDLDNRHYKYYIETSIDDENWKIVADRRNENCKSWQSICFDERLVVFIRIVGTANTANKDFHCVHFECPSNDCNEELKLAGVSK